MPRADCITKKGVFNPREKITINGLTAIRAHITKPSNANAITRSLEAKRKIKRLTAGKVIARQVPLLEIAAAQDISSNGNKLQQTQPTHGKDGSARHATLGVYHDYNRDSMMDLEDNEAQAAWAAGAARVFGGCIKAEKKDMEEEGERFDIGDQSFAFDSAKRQSCGQGDD